MRKSLASCASLLLAASGALVAPAAADADTDVCAGFGVMYTTAGLGAGGLLFPRTAGFSWTIVAGACALSSPLTASGIITGGCDYATGTGVTNSRHRFSFVSVGTRIYYTGEMTGTGHMFPDWLGTGNCAASTAQHFISSANVVLARRP